MIVERTISMQNTTTLSCGLDGLELAHEAWLCAPHRRVFPEGAASCALLIEQFRTRRAGKDVRQVLEVNKT